MRRTSPREVLPSEDVSAQIRELMDYAAEAGRRLRDRPGAQVYTESPNKPNADDLLFEGLRSVLEDEILPAGQLRDGKIDEREVAREVVKKALIGLKLEQLREAARKMNVSSVGNLEEIATRVASAYSWNEQEIARLILDFEDQLTGERATVDRLFPLSGLPDLDYAAARLDIVTGRYVRVGVARWFVFDDIFVDEDDTTGDVAEVVVGGSFRYYNASVNEFEKEPTLSATPSSREALAYITASPVLRIRRGNITTARAAVRALMSAARIEPKGYVVAGSVSPALDANSEFMLDLVYTRLREMGFGNPNLTVARFRVGETKGEEEGSPAPGSKPVLKAIRFEGSHLLDSVQACQLLALDNRPLVELSLLADYRSRERNMAGRFHLRISIDTDHVQLSTSYGDSPELSLVAHDALVEAARREIENGVGDSDRLGKLYKRLYERAHDQGEPEVATVLMDD